MQAPAAEAVAVEDAPPAVAQAAPEPAVEAAPAPPPEPLYSPIRSASAPEAPAAERPAPVAAPTAEARGGTSRPARRHIRVYLWRSPQPERDIRRARQVHGTLLERPGSDQFSLILTDGHREVEVDFSDTSTHYCPELHDRLIRIDGVEIYVD